MGVTRRWPRRFTSVRVTGGGMDPGPGGLDRGPHVSVVSPACVCDVCEQGRRVPDARCVFTSRPFFPENTSRRWREEAAQVFQASAAAAGGGGGGGAFIRMTKARPSLSERVCVCLCESLFHGKCQRLFVHMHVFVCRSFWLTRVVCVCVCACAAAQASDGDWPVPHLVLRLGADVLPGRSGLCRLRE